MGDAVADFSDSSQDVWGYLDDDRSATGLGYRDGLSAWWWVGLALFGILHKSKTHFVGVEYRDDADKPGAVLLEADKNNYRAILKVLEAVTDKPVKNAP